MNWLVTIVYYAACAVSAELVVVWSVMPRIVEPWQRATASTYCRKIRLEVGPISVSGRLCFFLQILGFVKIDVQKAINACTATVQQPIALKITQTLRPVQLDIGHIQKLAA